MRAAMRKREAIQPRYYLMRKPMRSSTQQAVRTGEKLLRGDSAGVKERGEHARYLWRTWEIWEVPVRAVEACKA